MVAPPEHPQQPSAARTVGFFKILGLFQNIPEASERKDFYSDLIRSLLKVDHIDRGQIACTLKVNASVVNPYNTLHGGVVSSVADLVGVACVKSVYGDKEFFLGEFSTAYLAAARLDDSHNSHWVHKPSLVSLHSSFALRDNFAASLTHRHRVTLSLHM